LWLAVSICLQCVRAMRRQKKQLTETEPPSFNYGEYQFIKGNHERDNLWKKIEEEKPKNVLTVTNYLELQIKKNNFILFHYPISNWNRMHYGSIMLHGHEHGAWQREGKILDVGIDNHPDHQLFSYDEIMEFMNNREIYIPNELNFNKGNL